SKAFGIALLFLAVPALLSLAFGRRPLAGEDAEAGGIVGRAVSEAARSRLGTTGAALLVVTLILIAVPLSTQVSLADVLFGLRVRLAGLFSRSQLGWARNHDRRTKERLRRTVVAKHLEKAKREGISLEDVPFASDDSPPFLREVPGPGKFSITKKTLAPGRVAAVPSPAKKKPAPPSQQRLPMPVDGYTYPPVSLLDKREGAGTVDRRVLAETGRRISEKCAEF